MTNWITYQCIIKYRVDSDTGRVEHLQGFTRPIGGTPGKSKPQSPKLDLGDIDEEEKL